MEASLSEILGISGSIVLIVTYSLLQFQKIKSDELLYTFLNAIGAGLILISLFKQFNLAAFIIEIFWLFISVVGMVRIYHVQKNKRLQQSAITQ